MVFYAVYITLIRKKLPDDDERSGWFSMAQLLGFLGLFNFFIFLPAALILNFTKRERFNALTLKQLSLVVGKGLLDNVFHRSKETSIELEPVTSFTDPPQIVSDSIRVDSSETQVS
ncbi:hypothetical protein Bca4012_076534 [Brassica carinata]|uniref:Uncharacterized protein n=1 Tax=Brassica carinata TaxID=52824 RepID=A0A8X7U5I8_BRACI|nr:hypothetical protein Bca52824_073103 [Brassica carinata]